MNNGREYHHNRQCLGDKKMAIIITNSPQFDINLIQWLWYQSDIIYCADGAANRLYDVFDSTCRASYIPHTICGDLDSIRVEVAEYYRENGANLVQVVDQDNNDIDKCLDSIAKLPHVAPESKLWTVLLVCPFGGRYDHEIALINSSFRWLDTFHRVALISNETLAHAIPAGRNEFIFEGEGYGPYCGFAALAGEAMVSTSGLRWNLQNNLLKMGVLTSTSNEISDERSVQTELDSSFSHPDVRRVIIETTFPIYWTCTIHSRI